MISGCCLVFPEKEYSNTSYQKLRAGQRTPDPGHSPYYRKKKCKREYYDKSAQDGDDICRQRPGSRRKIRTGHNIKSDKRAGQKIQPQSFHCDVLQRLILVFVKNGADSVCVKKYPRVDQDGNNQHGNQSIAQCGADGLQFTGSVVFGYDWLHSLRDSGINRDDDKRKVGDNPICRDSGIALQK